MGVIMNLEFPAAVPEIPVEDVDKAAAYYRRKLGFSADWGGEEGGIAGISKGSLQTVSDQSHLSRAVRQFRSCVDLAESRPHGRGERTVRAVEGKPNECRFPSRVEALGAARVYGRRSRRQSVARLL